MSYLRYHDYIKSIQLENLTQIINQDDNIRTDCELAAIEKIKTYLTQKFNVEEEFTDLTVYSRTIPYNAAITVELNGTTWISTTPYAADDIVLYGTNVYYALSGSTNNNPTTLTGNTWSLLGPQYKLYHTILPQEYFKFDKYYYTGDKVYWNGRVYTCIVPGVGYYPDVNTQNVKGSNYWGYGVVYTVPAATPLTDTTYWAEGDYRSQEMVFNAIDIVLYLIHKRIAPMNIPDLRVKAYDDAIKWLVDCYEGMITPNLLVRTPRSGGRFRIGSNPKNWNWY